MPVLEDSATVLVRCTGLAVICLNEAAQQVEVGFLRDNKHAFTFKILRPFYKNGSNNVISYREIATYQEFPNENVSIEIETDATDGFSTFKNDGFTRLSEANDKNDFQWLVNLGDLHAQDQLSATTEQPYALTRLSLSSGVLYTHQLDQKLVFSKVKRNANGVAALPEQFGRVAKTLGVALDGNQVNIKVRITGGMEATHPLPRIAGFPSIIEINNIDPDPYARYSDMVDYYKYVSSASGEQFDLEPITGPVGPTNPIGDPGILTRPGDPFGGPVNAAQSPVLTAGQVNQQDFCHPVVLPLRSLDDLKPPQAEKPNEKMKTRHADKSL